MRVECKLPHATQNWDSPIDFGSWNCTGSLLGCGKIRKGVQIFRPFQDSIAAYIPVQQDHHVTDALFMPKDANLMVVSSRSRRSFLWSSLNDPEMDDYVKVWDVEAEKVTKKYKFKGVVKKLAASTSLPNQFWFNVDRKAQKIAEVDTRSPSFKFIKLKQLHRKHVNFVNWRSFDVNPVDERTIAVGDLDKLLFYDRRTMSSSKILEPTKTVDVSSLNSFASFIVNVKYDPSGNKLIVTNSLSFNIQQYVAPSAGTSVENIRPLLLGNQTGTFTKNPKFLGEKHVLFDTEFGNCSVVFNLEDARYVGSIKMIGKNNFFTTNRNIPHPFYCLIASTNRDEISFITLSSSDVN